MYEEEEAAAVQGTNGQEYVVADVVSWTSEEAEKKEPSYCVRPIEVTEGSIPG